LLDVQFIVSPVLANTSWVGVLVVATLDAPSGVLWRSLRLWIVNDIELTSSPISSSSILNDYLLFLLTIKLLLLLIFNIKHVSIIFIFMHNYQLSSIAIIIVIIILPIIIIFCHFIIIIILII
jgi:hypothetical protein